MGIWLISSEFWKDCEQITSFESFWLSVKCLFWYHTVLEVWNDQINNFTDYFDQRYRHSEPWNCKSKDQPICSELQYV